MVLFGMGFTFGIPLSLIWTHHRRKMLELQIRLKNESTDNTQQSMNALREEMRALRDNTMQYDLSFDTAIQRMEQRMQAIERKTSQVESETQVKQRIGG
jgi:predicted  nucleic acid-binding Zn-ribbon protein